MHRGLAVLLIVPAHALASPPDAPGPDLPLPSPPGFVRYAADAAGPLPCGPNQVGIEAAEGDEGPESLLVVRAGRVIWQKTVRSEGIFGPHLSPVWCFDVTGDGEPELLVAEETGGTHCCRVETLVSLGPRPRVLLRFDDGGWGGDLTPLDAGAGAGLPYPLLAGTDPEGRWGHPLCGSHAERPFLPLVFALRGGRYVRAGRSERAVMSAIRAHAQARLTTLVAGGEGDSAFSCQEPFDILTASLALGDWPRARRTLPAPVVEMLDRERRFVARIAAPGR